MKLLKLAEIIHDAGTQSRVAIDSDAVSEYAERLESGEQSPPIVVFHDGSHYYLADGFHRLLAHKRAGRSEIAAEVQLGGVVEAVAYSVGANRSNGVRRTNADKRRCVELALKHFSDRSDRMISEMCGVGDHLVADVRKEQLRESRSSPAAPDAPAPKRVGKDGKARGPRTAANRPEADAKPDQPEPPKNKDYRPSNGLMYADTAIEQLKKIHPKDQQRDDGFDAVIAWINKNR